MTIPAGNNWCPTCEEVCHDHDRICTVCGTNLIEAPPPPPPLEASAATATRRSNNNAPMMRAVPEHMVEDLSNAGRELRVMLRNLQTRLDQVDTEQRELTVSVQEQMQQVLALAGTHTEQMQEEMQQVQQQMQQQMEQIMALTTATNTPDRPTSQSVLDNLPRTFIRNIDSSLLHTCRITVTIKKKNNEEKEEETSTTVNIPAVTGEFGLSPVTNITNGTLVVTTTTTTTTAVAVATETTTTTSNNRNKNNTVEKIIVFVPRGGGISFVQKAVRAQNELNAVACIIGNHVTTPWPFTMQDSKKEATTLGLQIPVVMVSKEHSDWLQQHSADIQMCELCIEKKKDNDSNDVTCCVCTDSLADTTIVTLPHCSHTFHSDCALVWLSKHNTCPYCRHALPLQDAQQEEERLAAATANRQEQAEASANAFYG